MLNDYNIKAYDHAYDHFDVNVITIYINISFTHVKEQAHMVSRHI